MLSQRLHFTQNKTIKLLSLLPQKHYKIANLKNCLNISFEKAMEGRRKIFKGETFFPTEASECKKKNKATDVSNHYFPPPFLQ